MCCVQYELKWETWFKWLLLTTNRIYGHNCCISGYGWPYTEPSHGDDVLSHIWFNSHPAGESSLDGVPHWTNNRRQHTHHPPSRSNSCWSEATADPDTGKHLPVSWIMGRVCSDIVLGFSNGAINFFIVYFSLLFWAQTWQDLYTFSAAPRTRFQSSPSYT